MVFLSMARYRTCENERLTLTGNPTKTSYMKHHGIQSACHGLISHLASHVAHWIRNTVFISTVSVLTLPESDAQPLCLRGRSQSRRTSIEADLHRNRPSLRHTPIEGWLPSRLPFHRDCPPLRTTPVEVDLTRDEPPSIKSSLDTGLSKQSAEAHVPRGRFP